MRSKQLYLLKIFNLLSRYAMRGFPSAIPNISSTGVIIITAVLWGATDAAIKQVSPPISNSILSYAASLVCTPAYLSCLLLNQVGSLLYYYALTTAPLSLVR